MVGFILFIVFVLKTASMYFDLTYYYYQFICVSSMTEFSKEQNKQGTSRVHHNHYCNITFLADFK